MATDKKKIQETENSGFGAYDTGRGGGTPVDGGGRGAWHKAGEPGHRDEDQPRTSDGKFTYNSVNGKGLAPSSNPDRGSTINPLLTGGQNGIQIKDVEEQFDKKEGSYWDKYKGSWYKAGGEFVTGSGKTVVAAKPIWQVARGSYDTVKGEFKGESEAFTTKKGRTGKEEAAAKQKVEATGQEQAVTKADTGEIKVKPGTQEAGSTYITPKKVKTFMEDKEMPGAEKIKAPETETPVTPNAPTTGEPKTITPTANTQPFGSGKYNMGQAEAVKAEIKAQLGDEYDEDMWDDATIEEFIEANGGEKMFAPQEKDSEGLDKIKDLGFKE